MKTITTKRTFPIRRESDDTVVQGHMDFNREIAAREMARKLVDAGHIAIEHLITRDAFGAGIVETAVTIRVEG